MSDAPGEAGEAAAPARSDIHDIQRRIPHRYPFLLVDRVEEIRLGESAVGIKSVTFNEPHFQGHFPGAPVMPGVAIVEAMAQTAAVLVSHTLELRDRDVLIYFMGIDKARFRRQVVPGDRLELHVRALRRGTRIWRFAGQAMVDGQLAAEAEFSAMLDLRD